MSRSKSTQGERARGVRLGKAIKAARTSRGLSQADLSQRAAMALDTLRVIEQGHRLSPGVFAIADIAAALDLTIESLLRRTHV